MAPPQSLRNLQDRPLDQWEPVDAAASEAGNVSAPLSLRYLAEHTMEEWNEGAIPGVSAGTAAPLPLRRAAVGGDAVATADRVDAVLVFRAAFQEWLVDQPDKHPDDPEKMLASGKPRTITPEQLGAIANKARTYLGLDPLLPQPDGERRVITVELCEALRPDSSDGSAGDAAYIVAYLCGEPGTARGEQDLHSLLGLQRASVVHDAGHPMFVVASEPLAENPSAEESVAARAATSLQLRAEQAGQQPAASSQQPEPQVEDTGVGTATTPEMTGATGPEHGQVVQPLRQLARPSAAADSYNFTLAHSDLDARDQRKRPTTTVTMGPAGGGLWRAATVGNKVMRSGEHYVRFRLFCRKAMFVLGVVRPDFDPTSGDLPSGPACQGWGYSKFCQAVTRPVAGPALGSVCHDPRL